MVDELTQGQRLPASSQQESGLSRIMMMPSRRSSRTHHFWCDLGANVSSHGRQVYRGVLLELLGSAFASSPFASLQISNHTIGLYRPPTCADVSDACEWVRETLTGNRGCVPSPRLPCTEVALQSSTWPGGTSTAQNSKSPVRSSSLRHVG